MVEITLKPPTIAKIGVRGISYGIPRGDITTYLRYRSGGYSSGVARIKSEQEAMRRAAAARQEAERQAKIVAARQEAERQAREEAARKARLARIEILKKIREEVIRKRLSNIERNKLIARALARIESIRRRTGERVRKRTVLAERSKEIAERRRIIAEKIAKLSIEQRVINILKRNGRKVPVVKTFVVDEKGKVVREATVDEKRIIRETRRTIKGPRYKRVLPTIDYVTGGALTRREFRKEQEKINKQVEDFNKKYGGKELSESSYNIALGISESIEQKEKKLRDEQEKYVKGKGKYGRVPKPGFPKSYISEKVKEKRIEDAEKGLKELREKERKRKEEGKKISSILKKNIGYAETKLESEKKLIIGSTVQELATGVVPIGFAPGVIPITMAAEAHKPLVLFDATTKMKKGKLVADISFKYGKRTGLAKDVALTSKGDSFSIQLGKFGIKTIRGAKQVFIKKRAFGGFERGVTKPAKFMITALRKGKRPAAIVKVNVKGLLHQGAGKVATVKGEKFIRPVIRLPTGKLVMQKVKGIKVKDFSDMASIFSAKNLSLIIGRTLVGKTKTQFMGLVRGTSKVGKTFSLSGTQKIQYARALSKVVSVASAAMVEADKIKGLSKVGRLAVASQIISKGLSKASVIPLVEAARPTEVIKPKPKPEVIAEAEVVKVEVVTTIGKRRSGVSSAQIPAQVEKQKTKLLQISKEAEKLKQASAMAITQIQRTRYKQRLRQLTRQTQKLVKMIRPFYAIPRPSILKVPFASIPFPKRKRVRKKIKVVKKKGGYDVYARPLKKKGQKKTPKLIKINKVSLSKIRAEDLRNYIIDTSLARTGRIKRTAKKPRKPSLKIPSRYSIKTKPKFRTYKIRKKKRVPLKKGKVIERKKYLLDTRQEKKKITLLKRLAELEKKSRFKKPVRRSPTRSKTRKSQSRKVKFTPRKSTTPSRGSPQRSMPIKRKATPQQLRNLARGRRILAQKRRK